MALYRDLVAIPPQLHEQVRADERETAGLHLWRGRGPLVRTWGAVS
jgi:hypothetical protein